MFILCVLFAVVVLAGLVFLFLKNQSSGGVVDSAVPAGVQLEYKARPILTAAESRFFRWLVGILPSQFAVFPQVGLAAIVKNTAPAGWPKISQKRLDFVVVRCDTLQPVLVIELDDASHNRECARKSDSEKDAILQSAGYKVVRVPVSGDYSEDTYNEYIVSHLV